MFGTPEGPWNITKRLEQKLGPRLHVSGLLEFDLPRAEGALKLKRESNFAKSYAQTVVAKTVDDFKQSVDAGKAKAPLAIFIATTPQYRGGLSAPNDLELQVNKAFPDAAIFLEKPVSTGVPWEKSVNESKEVGKFLEENQKGPISIGYVLRYLKAVKEMKKIIEDNNLTVMAVNARFITAYELAIKTDWWDKSIVHGPIIEQGTHLCDLVRYLGGEIDMDTVQAHAVEAHEKPGKLSKTNFDQSKISDDNQIPRVTTATWKYESGAVGNLLHAIALHTGDWSIQVEVYADGYELILADPFGSPALHVRRPGTDHAEIIPTPGPDDPYQTEMDHFIDAIEGGNLPILCTYEDAAKTYEFTWKIRLSSEESTRKQLAKKGKSS
ncbi:hypothetical protein P7C73_g3851, partial [Tremellales sp. Uapishka_1]